MRATLSTLPLRSYVAVQNAFARLTMPRRGQGLVEYALIISLVSIVVIAALVVLGPKISAIFTKANSNL